MAKTFVGSRVRQLRSERGFRQDTLAQMLDISPSYLNQIEHDVRPLTVAVLLRITEVFGVDATFFASQDDTRLLAELREVTLDHDLGVEVAQSALPAACRPKRYATTSTNGRTTCTSWTRQPKSSRCGCACTVPIWFATCPTG